MLLCSLYLFDAPFELEEDADALTQLNWQLVCVYLRHGLGPAGVALTTGRRSQKQSA